MKTGGDLRYYLRKRYLFEERDVAFYVACISSALEHLHSRNVIHRDIKPENIILDERGYPYLTDFGVAYVHNNEDPSSDGTLTCTLASGTKQYLAPEVFTKSHVHGPEVDYWSLGVVAFELLFGKRPFDKHCPIQFINYLEKALSAMRKKNKELHMKELSLATISESQTVSSGKGFDSPARSNMGMNASALSPSQSQEFSSPNTRHGSTFKESSKEKAPSSRSKPIPFPNVRTSNSNEATSVDKELMYFSSVGYTQQSPISLSLETNGERRRLNMSPSLLSNDQSSAGVPSDTSQKTVNYAFSDTESVGGGSTSGNRRSDCSTKEHLVKLPDISGKGSNLRSHQPVHGSRTDSPVPIFKKDVVKPDLVVEGTASPNLPANVLSEDPESLLKTKAIKSGRAIPGDHWLVEDGELSPSLVAPIPPINPWLGALSLECQQVLEGLFEVRPSHRMGCRNFQKLKSHHWFEMFHLSRWEDLKHKAYPPNFQPGKRFIKDSLERINDLTQARFLGEDDDSQSNSETMRVSDIHVDLSPEQDEQFRDFFFIHSNHKHLFPQSSGHIVRYNSTGQIKVHD
jgi:serine/threonine protein kinase